MKISGTTVIYNGLSAGYPFVEAILAVLPHVDEFIVSEFSDDGTKEVLDKMAKRYSNLFVVTDPWPLEMGPEVISHMTNRSFEHCTGDYLVHCQADEVFTEHAIQLLTKRIREENNTAYLVNRTQVGPNFQTMWGAPCCLVRAGKKGNIISGCDGMNMRIVDEQGVLLEPDSPNIHMFDLSKVFPGNYQYRCLGQSRIWWHLPDGNSGAWYNKNSEQWTLQIQQWENEGYPEEYLKTDSMFDSQLPELLKFWVGRPRYYAREDLICEQ